MTLWNDTSVIVPESIHIYDVERHPVLPVLLPMDEDTASDVSFV